MKYIFIHYLYTVRTGVTFLVAKFLKNYFENEESINRILLEKKQGLFGARVQHALEIMLGMY